MAIIDANNYFTTPGTPYAPTASASESNLAPLTIDTAPLTLPSGSGGGSSTGYGSGSATNAGRDLGIGGEMWVEVMITTAVAQTSGGAIFYLVTDATATLASVVTQTGVGVLISSPNMTAAQLALPTANGTVGYWRAQLPASGKYLEFIGLSTYIFTNNWTAGAFEAKLLTNIQQSDLYQSGIAIA